jgi:hypothetical protein
VITAVEGTLRRARNANELLVGVRAFQSAALWSGWHVRISPRDAAFAAAIALDTAATNHKQWPLPGTVNPTAQALAALAWGTAASSRELEDTTLNDLDPACATFRGHAVDPWLRPPLRALRWQQVRHRARGPNDRIFPRIGTIRKRLNAVAPTAYNAAECDESRYRRALAEITRVVKIDHDASPGEIAADNPRLPMLPSARYRDWARTHTPYPRHRDDGLPDPEDEYDALTIAGSRVALTALLGHDLADISTRATRG